MAWYRSLSRRDFIKLAAAAAVASGASSCSKVRTTPWRFLSVDEARTLAAVCDRLIPPDADPGADWARVVNFMDMQLCGAYRELRATYREGIRCLERASRAQSGKRFAELTADRQDALLTVVERGENPGGAWDKVAPGEFFAVVLDHTMQGFYGDPRHGGNRERISWKMVGLAYPPVRGRQHYGADS